MKYLGLVLALCGAAGLTLAPVAATAFEIQGKDQDIPDSAAEFHGLAPVYAMPEFQGSSLAMPFNSSGGDSSHVSDYGNAIPIPGPGIDQPTPAWAAGPFR
ncbi:MAG TPA: hypothetical protein VMW57_09650 [Methyloceanibacter sp.]|nr:hypothetical protein [Methyloceanibacter sp.]